MKKPIVTALAIVLMLTLAGGISTAFAQSEAAVDGTLVVYFSRVGNTAFDGDVDVVSSASLNMENGELAGNAQLLAGMIASETGGDLFMIQTEAPYPTDYRQTTDVAMDEQRANARPALVTQVENFESYRTIFLVYPNWWGTLPQPLFTFLEAYDFAGKTVAPLCTHEGSGLGSSVRDMAALIPDATIVDGLAVRGGSAAASLPEVQGWLTGIEYAVR